MTRAERRHRQARVVDMWLRRNRDLSRVDAAKHASYRGMGCRAHGCKLASVQYRQRCLEIDAALRAEAA